MTIADKLVLEFPQSTVIYLHREGLFWKAFEYSALKFVKDIKAYKVLKKYIKAVKKEVVSLGFPDSCLEEVLTGFSYVNKTEKLIEISGLSAITEEEFCEWKKAQPLYTDTVIAEQPEISTLTQNAFQIPQISARDKVLIRLQQFQVETATPMQCMLFISELQKELKNDL